MLKIKTCDLLIRINFTSELPFQLDTFVHVQDCFSHTKAILNNKKLQDQLNKNKLMFVDLINAYYRLGMNNFKNDLGV